MLEFHPIDSYIIEKTNDVLIVFTGPNPYKCWDFDHLIDQYIIINGMVRKVVGVEKFMHCEPYLKGESIGIAVKAHREWNEWI